jgi:hypothetical protein
MSNVPISVARKPPKRPDQIRPEVTELDVFMLSLPPNFLGFCQILIRVLRLFTPHPICHDEALRWLRWSFKYLIILG